MNPLDESALARVAPDEPQGYADARRTAFSHFEKLGMPDAAEELWKYIELDFDIADFGLVDQPAASTPVSLAGWMPAIRIVDGLALPSSEDAGDAVLVRSLRKQVADDASVLDPIGVGIVPPDRDVFSAASAAFGADGAIVRAGRGAVSAPVLIDVVAATPGAVTFPRIVVITEDTAEVSVIVHLRSPEGLDALVVPRLEIAAGPASNVKVSLVQNLGRATRSIAHVRAAVGRDANLVLAEAGLGASLSRLQLTIDLEGRGSSANVVGAYFGDEDQVLDYRYLMHHAGLNTKSDMFLKGAVEDEALSVFTGMIRIDESAQRTDAFQTNRNLILSEGAAAQSVPNLEILANDVKCGHGSTMGPLDPEQRYYLMSRGLDPERADRLQVRGFFHEALARFPHDELVTPLGEWINTKFVEAQEEGRV